MANAVSNVSFQSPGYDYNADISDIERKRALAAALQQQGMEQQGGTQVIGGFAVPQGPQYGKMASALAGSYTQKKATEEQRALAEKSQSDYRQMLAGAMKHLQGSPATQMSQDASGNVTPAQPAVAPNPMAAMEAFGSHPQGAQFMPFAMQQMQRQQLAEALKGGQGGAAPAPQPPQGNPMLASNGGGGGDVSIMAPQGGSGPAPQAPAPLQIPQAQGPRAGGPAGGLPMEAWIQVDPSGKLYMEQLAKDHAETGKPVINRGFGLGTMQNGRYVPDPASYDQALGIERSKAAMGVHHIQPAAGGSVPVFGNQLPGFGGLPGSPQGPQQPAPQPALPAAAVRPTAPVAAPGGDPWASMPKRIIPQGIGESTYNKATATQSAEAGAKIAEKLGGVAQTANERKSFNDQALQMLPQATTGPGSLKITGIQSFLNSRFGVPLEVLEKASAGDAAATQELNKNLLNAATKTAKANYGSRMTQSEVMMQIQQGSPNVDMTRAAIGYLLNADNARANYEVKQGQDVGRYLQQGGDPYQFEGWYAKNFPMTSAIKAGVSNPVKDVVASGGKLSPAEQAEREALRKRFGR